MVLFTGLHRHLAVCNTIRWVTSRKPRQWKTEKQEHLFSLAVSGRQLIRESVAHQYSEWNFREVFGWQAKHQATRTEEEEWETLPLLFLSVFVFYSLPVRFSRSPSLLRSSLCHFLSTGAKSLEVFSWHLCHAMEPSQIYTFQITMHVWKTTTI